MAPQNNVLTIADAPTYRRRRMSAQRRIQSPIELPVSSAPPYPGDEDDDYGAPNGDRRAIVQRFLQLSKKRFMTADAASSTFRNAMRRDQLFAAGMGNQWETEDRQARADEGRPCLEINRIPQFIRQVSNQNRANRSQIKIAARGKGATVDVANALQALVRSVEVDSDADVAYDTATEHQLRSGLGFIRLSAKWALDDSWEQICRIGRIRNPLSVYWDPSTQEADFADMRWLHVIGVIGKDEYESRWGKWGYSQGLSDYMMPSGAQQMDDWAPEGKVRIAEYYYKEIEERLLLRLDTGQNVWEPELEHYREMFALSRPGEPAPQVVRERQVQKPVVYWCFHNGVEILEGNKDHTAGRELPGTRIPIFPVIGDEYDLDGQVDYRGMVRDARDPQKMYNFWASSIAEAVALAPKAPWVAAKGQVEQYLEDWQNANRIPKAVLVYDPKAVGDQLVPPPQRNAIEPAIQAMVQGLMEADRDLKSVMGLFEPSLGERKSSSESGKAILAQQQQGQMANSNYLDNLQRTKRSIGRALLEWIPVVYDVPRVEHLLNPDGKRKTAIVYSGEENKPQEGEFPADITDIYDVGVGYYDATVSTGPSYKTEKEQTQAWLLDLFKVLPGLAALGADILLEASDDPSAQQLAKRAKQALPPHMQDETDPAAQVPMLQAKLQQAEQLIQQSHQMIEQMSTLLQSKELDNATKKEVAMIQANAQLAVAALKAGNEAGISMFNAEFERFQTLVGQIHEKTVLEMNNQQAEVDATRQEEAQIRQIREQREADSAVAAAQPPPAPKPGA